MARGDEKQVHFPRACAAQIDSGFFSVIVVVYMNKTLRAVCNQRCAERLRTALASQLSHQHDKERRAHPHFSLSLSLSSLVFWLLDNAHARQRGMRREVKSKHESEMIELLSDAIGGGGGRKGGRRAL